MKSRSERHKNNNLSRTARNFELYETNEYDNTDFDLNTNVREISADPNNINVDKIKELLETRVEPQRTSISVDDDMYETRVDKYKTKEYDINEVLNRAKTSQALDYEEERLKKVANTNNYILENLREEEPRPLPKRQLEDEKELLNLINTITEIELQNKIKSSKEGQDLLNLLNTKTDEIKPSQPENSFYTGNLLITEDDFEDFKDIEKEIKSNSALINILIIIFSVVLLAILLFFVNQIFDLGWF